GQVIMHENRGPTSTAVPATVTSGTRETSTPAHPIGSPSRNASGTHCPAQRDSGADGGRPVARPPKDALRAAVASPSPDHHPTRMRSAQQYLLGMFRRIAIVTASVLALTAGCTSEPEEPEHEPSGSALVRDASSSLKDLTSVQFDLRTQGALEGFPIRSLQGAATRDGRAFGDVDMQLPTERVQYEFAMGQDRATPPAGA